MLSTYSVGFFGAEGAVIGTTWVASRTSRVMDADRVPWFRKAWRQARRMRPAGVRKGLQQSGDRVAGCDSPCGYSL